MCARQAQLGTLFMESLNSPNRTIVVTYLKVMMVMEHLKVLQKK